MRLGVVIVASGLVVSALGLAGGVFFELLLDQRDGPYMTPRGQSVEVDGVPMQLRCLGQGSPTVLLEAGAFSTMANWALVQAEIAALTRVCAYDRAGLGWSAPAPGPVDGPAQVKRLQALLREAHVSGPFVIVGHSYGGVLARLFAKARAYDTVGLVTVDSSHPNQATRMEEASVRWSLSVAAGQALPPIAGAFGLTRLLSGDFYARAYADLPDWAYRQVRQFAFDPAFRRAATAEVAAAWNSRWALELERTQTSLGDLPLAVVSAGRQPRGWFATETDRMLFARVWRAQQEAIAALSRRSRHIIVDGATHNSLLGRREHAERTVEAVRWVIEQARDQGLKTPAASQGPRS